MDDALKQALGELLLNAVPTIILFLLLYVAYRKLVHEPLMKVLSERHARTTGAVAKAQADIAEAESRTAEYEQRLRDARTSVFKTMEARRKNLLEMRSAALAEAKAAAMTQIKAAKSEIEKETATAKSGLQAQAENLATEVIRTILKTSASQLPAAGSQ
jgi:F-type H+-transporting ATPase subunit b